MGSNRAIRGKCVYFNDPKDAENGQGKVINGKIVIDGPTRPA